MGEEFCNLLCMVTLDAKSHEKIKRRIAVRKEAFKNQRTHERKARQKSQETTTKH